MELHEEKKRGRKIEGVDFRPVEEKRPNFTVERGEKRTRKGGFSRVRKLLLLFRRRGFASSGKSRDQNAKRKRK